MNRLDHAGEPRTPTHVRGLPLPTLLIDLLTHGRWQHPGDGLLRKIMPWFEDPLDFLGDIEQIRRESRTLDLLTEDDATAQLFRQTRGSSLAEPVELPWLDIELSVLIAVNRNLGDDVALALDYRTSTEDPRVVGSDFWTGPAHRCAWRVVAPTFSEFVSALHLPASA